MSRQATPEQYFEAAMTLLAAGGPAALKIAPVCRSVGVTSGSFYHHFGSWADFVDALLRWWETEQTVRILALTRAAPDPWARVEVLKRLAAALPHAAEAAIRAWAAYDEAVRRAQQRMDRERLAALAEVIGGVGVEPVTARRLADLGLAILVGQQGMHRPPDPSALLAVLTGYEQVIVAHAPRR